MSVSDSGKINNFKLLFIVIYDKYHFTKVAYL